MSSIIDNRNGNTLIHNLKLMSAGGGELCIATAFFSLDALLMLADNLGEYERVRILFGDDSSAQQRRRLLEMLRTRSDADLLVQRESVPNLSPLRIAQSLFKQGKVEARCYTAQKFHAKSYLIKRPTTYPPELGIIGSGNFTRPGLSQNIELNCSLSLEQVAHLRDWFEERWEEAQADVVTDDVLAEISRQIDLYQPHLIYLKALMLWGAQQEADTPAAAERTGLLDALDPHQEQGYRRALKILDRENGVLVADPVGVGKSFIALALMEHYCRRGQRVLLIAPKNILTSSWQGYLATYLQRYRKPFESISEIAMTELGFDATEVEGEDDNETLAERRELLRGLFERADVVVVDESHNFRTSSSDRYKNLYRIMESYRGKPKKTILMTATPINTAYRDISNQLALITHDRGNIGGYSIEQVKKYANELDKQHPTAGIEEAQLNLALVESSSELLNKVLSSVVIQRSRATCKALAEAVGKEVRFPSRSAPKCIQVTIGPESEAYRDLIRLADNRFRPGVEFLRQMRLELEKADKSGKNVVPVKLLKGAEKGLKLAAFLTEQYRRVPTEGRRTYQNEVHLAALVFANTLKQLESSPAALQGILQSLGLGLIARLQHVLGDTAAPLVAPHQDWVRSELFGSVETAVDDADAEVDDGDSLDASGDEPDEWLAQAIRARQLSKKLRGFNEETFDVARWRDDIVADLGFLQEIHTATVAARQQPDPKLAGVLPKVRNLVDAGKRVLVFTQSQRTAEYLEKELRTRLEGFGVARIDSRVEKTRAAILHAFCPGYNKEQHAPSVPKRVDVLISTDVLSEGVNLQEAGAILSYDIHWNPVRLIQRIGRVDRRLSAAISPEGHSFDIVNVLPAKEINDIIGLVGTVENRTLMISQALGLDVSFFKSNDPAGNLKEFNATYEGDIPAAERMLAEYAVLAAIPPDAATQRLLDALPRGAFGVWDNAPQDGLFALFTMEPRPNTPAADLERLAAVIGRPVLALERHGKSPTFDAGEILTMLHDTVPGAHSGTPSDEQLLSSRLKKLKASVRQQFMEINLPDTIRPSLVCWLELRKGNA